MFERKRNRPVKYDRDLLHTTISAIKKVSDIRKKRENAFYAARFGLLLVCSAALQFVRMVGKKATDKADALKELSQSLDLVVTPSARSARMVAMAAKTPVSAKKQAAAARMEE